MQARDRALGAELVLDELFDLTLYERLEPLAPPPLRKTLQELAVVERRHLAFWRGFYGLSLDALDLPRRLKLGLLVAVCRVLGAPAILLVLQAIEIYGIRKYLLLWESAKGTELAEGLRPILEDEFRHEDAIVSVGSDRRLDAESVRSLILGFNDGLVELVGATSGFFAALGEPRLVLMAGASVAAAGSFSMGAGAFAAGGSEREMRLLEDGRARFLGEPPTQGAGPRPLRSALLVGAAYSFGAAVPLLPVALGARAALAPLAAGFAAIALVSSVLAFLSGMRVRRRMAVNGGIVLAAVTVSYLIGIAARALWGIDL